MMDVVLYTKEGCGLCDKAKRQLLDLAQTHPLTIREVDISADPELTARYFDKIPVIIIGERRLAAPIDPDTLHAAISDQTSYDR